jgi:hypothetical protein
VQRLSHGSVVADDNLQHGRLLNSDGADDTDLAVYIAMSAKKQVERTEAEKALLEKQLVANRRAAQAAELESLSTRIQSLEKSVVKGERIPAIDLDERSQLLELKERVDFLERQIDTSLARRGR